MGGALKKLKFLRDGVELEEDEFSELLKGV
jgi:hypothetical protein